MVGMVGMVGMVAQQSERTEHCGMVPLEMVQIVHFMLCAFYHNLKRREG